MNYISIKSTYWFTAKWLGPINVSYIAISFVKLCHLWSSIFVSIFIEWKSCITLYLYKTSPPP